MCRMLLLKGEFKGDFSSLFLISQKISEADPLHYVSDSFPKNHIDGWGYVYLNADSINYYRTSEPLYESFEPSVRDGYLLLHMRNRSGQEPVGVGNSHPFHLSTTDGDYYLAHNGHFNKKMISDYLGLTDSDKENDTLVFLRFLVSLKGDIIEKINHSIKKSLEMNFIDSLANLFLVFVDKSGKIHAFAISESSPHLKYSLYDELYIVEDKHWKGVFSSSYIKFKEISENRVVNKLRRGILYEL
ncbi:MAG: class II glutamine amidotransferase [Thermoplasmata archaeon]